MSDEQWEVETSEQVKHLLEEHRERMGVSRRVVSERAGYAHASYWWWTRKGGQVGLEAALCYLRVLGFKVLLVRTKPLV